MECLQYFKAFYSDRLVKITVLNLVINGMPSILYYPQSFEKATEFQVLNLVINGMPSIQKTNNNWPPVVDSFKPCYKWNAFNTKYIS